MTVVQLNQAANSAYQVIQRQGAVTLWNRQAQFPIQFVTTYTPQIVASSVEEQALDERAGVVNSGRITWAHLLIEL